MRVCRIIIWLHILCSFVVSAYGEGAAHDHNFVGSDETPQRRVRKRLRGKQRASEYDTPFKRLNTAQHGQKDDRASDDAAEQKHHEEMESNKGELNYKRQTHWQARREWCKKWMSDHEPSFTIY